MFFFLGSPGRLKFPTKKKSPQEPHRSICQKQCNVNVK